MLLLKLRIRLGEPRWNFAKQIDHDIDEVRGNKELLKYEMDTQLEYPTLHHEPLKNLGGARYNNVTRNIHIRNTHLWKSIAQKLSQL